MAKINLLPWRENLRQQRQKNFLASLAVAALVAIGVVLVANMGMNNQISGQENRNNFLRGEIRKLDTAIARIERLERTRDDLVTRKNVIERLQTNRSMMVHLFNQLAQTLPEGITLNTVRQAGQQLTIGGTSESESRVSEYMRNIERAEWLHSPTLRIVVRSESADRPGQPHRFELTARVAAPGQEDEEN